MANLAPAFDFNAALHNPTHFFGEPEEVLHQTALSDEMKIQILKEWERDARSLMVAEDEGMDGGESARLGRVRAALHRLQAGHHSESHTGTQHGS